MSVVPCSFLFLFVLLCLPVLTEAKRQPGEGKAEKPRQPPTPPQPAKRPRDRSVPGSGELTTKGGHRCTWQTSGEGLVTLLVNCSTESLDHVTYSCRYAGKPDLCQAYGVKSSQYWKQLVGKLKKRQSACSGEKILKAKTCKKAPAEAHMKLVRHIDEEERKEGKKKGQAAGKSSEGGKAERRRKKEEEEEEEKKLEDWTGFDDEGVVNDMDPVQSYCSEGWHAVCSFFVKFFEG